MNKFRRDEHLGADDSWRRRDPIGDRYPVRAHEERHSEDRLLRSPEQQFETSQPYRQPSDEAWRQYGPDRERSSYDFSERTGGRGSPEWQGYAPAPFVADWQQRGGFHGRGPKGYTRSDERIREDVCERLSGDDEVDATEVTVRVQSGEVTLEGSVPTRHMKRVATYIAENISGVQDVHNVVRVSKPLLTELKEKLTGEQKNEHHANTGTRASTSH